MPKYQHLFFDLDHTLWDFESNSRVTLQELFDTLNLQEKGIASFDFFFERYTFHNTRLWKRYTRGQIKQEDLRWKRMWLALLDAKIADEPLAKEMAVLFLKSLPEKTTVFPYTFEILDYLKSKSYQLHLITNGFEEVQQRKIARSGLTPYFTTVVTSETAQSLKPQPEIFDYALKMAAANAQQSIMIGDNQDADIKGAKNAGWDTVFVNHINEEPIVESTYTIVHLQELENIF